MAKKPTPKDAPKVTRDCYDDCGKAYDSCMNAAGSSTAAQAVCNTRYSSCIQSCPAK